MKIKADDIPESGLSLDLTEEGPDIERAAGGLNFSFLTPVAAHLDITGADRDVHVAGKIEAGLSLTCGRCLKDFGYRVSNGFSLFFAREKVTEREKELKASDMDVNYLSGPEIDTTELILAQLSLEVPMQPLCAPDCRGLCPRCGADLNAGDCACRGTERVDPRLAGLKDFGRG
jgi:uncharacterized protein